MFSKLKPSALKIIEQLQKNKHTARILEQMGFRDYDLPLSQSEDSRFLVLLIGLMSFLAVLACSGTFALNGMTSRWSSGLENKVTIEIPVETKEGHLLSSRTVQKETKKLENGLKNHRGLKSVTVLTNEDIQDLISPWIGDELSLNDIPLPGLIALELRYTDAESLAKLERDIHRISKYAQLETHHEWLADLMRFANALKALALFIALVIGGTTVIAIAAGVRTRLAIHRKEVELLHSMGATDNYIARQFQRHAMIIALQGGAIGTIGGMIITGGIIMLSARSGTPLIPTIEIGSSGIALLCSIPVLASLIAMITSRFTVLRSLIEMP